MEQLFLTLVEVSLSSSLIIAAVCLCSSRINRSFVPGWKYWFWLLLALRLLIPWNPELPATAARIDLPLPALPLSNVPGTAATFQPGASALTALGILWRLWLAGMVALALWQGFKYRRFRREALCWSRPVEAGGPLVAQRGRVAEELGLKKVPQLLWNQQLQSPLLLGFLRPVVLLPRQDYEERELYFILRHELTHYKRRDLWYKALLLTAGLVHWWNPLVWLLVRCADQDLELSCDGAVVAGQDRETRQQYSQVILANIRRSRQAKTLLTTSFSGGKKMMKERFLNILNEQKRRRGLLLLTALLLCVLLLGGLVACGSEPQDALESALSAITLEKYPHSDEATLALFKEYVRSLSPESAESLLEDEALVAYMLNPFYWE